MGVITSSSITAKIIKRFCYKIFIFSSDINILASSSLVEVLIKEVQLIKINMNKIMI